MEVNTVRINTDMVAVAINAQSIDTTWRCKAQFMRRRHEPLWTGLRVGIGRSPLTEGWHWAKPAEQDIELDGKSGSCDMTLRGASGRGAEEMHVEGGK